VHYFYAADAANSVSTQTGDLDEIAGVQFFDLYAVVGIKMVSDFKLPRVRACHLNHRTVALTADRFSGAE